MFEGNVNSEGVVRHELQHAILARYIRFIPVDWSREGRIGVRLELYGCSYCGSIFIYLFTITSHISIIYLYPFILEVSKITTVHGLAPVWWSVDSLSSCVMCDFIDSCLHLLTLVYLCLLLWWTDTNPEAFIEADICPCALKSFSCCLLCSGADVISFDGHGVISYRFRSKKVKILKDVISLKFRTTAGNGVLLHGEGQQGDYISLELRRARLQLSINLGSSTSDTQHPDDRQQMVLTRMEDLQTFYNVWPKDVLECLTKGNVRYKLTHLNVLKWRLISGYVYIDCSILFPHSF